MIDPDASDACRAAIRPMVGSNAAGAVYYVLRDGKPFVDASFGDARRPGSPDGRLAYGPDTIVHVASISKFICAVAVLRLIDDWNEIFGRTILLRGRRYYLGPRRPQDAFLIKQVVKVGRSLSLASTVYDLLEPFLDQDIVAAAKSANNNVYPGTGVASITIQDLLAHTSGLRDQLFGQIAQLGLDEKSIIDEAVGSGKAIFDTKKITTIILGQNCAAKTRSYCNDGFNVAGALVDFLTGTPFEDWCRRAIFPSRAFGDIARRPVDMSRAARYYQPDGGGGLTGGDHHPDYRDFGACGGWYTSARAFCEWVRAVMQGRRFGGLDLVRPRPFPLRLLEGVLWRRLGKPIISDPMRLFTLRMGFDDGPLDLGYLRGETKNGGTGTPGTSTNARFIYLRGYGRYDVVAFTQANGALDANPLLERGLPSLHEGIYDPTPRPENGLPERSEGVDLPGLRQLVCWEEGGAAKAVRRSVNLAVEPVPGNPAATRTNLFPEPPYAPSRSVNSPAFMRLLGTLRSIEAGTYTFRLTSDDGAMLWIAGRLVVDNDDARSVRSREGTAELGHDSTVRFMLYWYNLGVSGAVSLEWKRPGQTTFEAVPPGRFHQDFPRRIPLR